MVEFSLTREMFYLLNFDWQVIRFVDGRRYVIVIAKDADMDLKIVKLVIRSLM